MEVKNIEEKISKEKSTLTQINKRISPQIKEYLNNV